MQKRPRGSPNRLTQRQFQKRVPLTRQCQKRVPLRDVQVDFNVKFDTLRTLLEQRRLVYNMKGRSALSAHMGRKHKSNEYPKEYVKYVVDEYYTECKFSIHYCCILYLYKVIMEEMTQEKEEEVIGRFRMCM